MARYRLRLLYTCYITCQLIVLKMENIILHNTKRVLIDILLISNQRDGYRLIRNVSRQFVFFQLFGKVEYLYFQTYDLCVDSRQNFKQGVSV